MFESERRAELEAMTLAAVRRHVQEAGWGLPYLWERPKAELIDIILRRERAALKEATP